MNRKVTFIDLFAGCGGLSLGLEQAGFKPLLFNEISASARETYKKNRPLSGHSPDIVEDATSLDKDYIQKLKNKIDYEHYIKKQITPIADQVLSLFGKSLEEINSKSKQSKLF